MFLMGNKYSLKSNRLKELGATNRFILEVPPQLAALLGDLGDLDAGLRVQDALPVLAEPQHEGGGGPLGRVRVFLTFFRFVLAFARGLRLEIVVR